MLKQLFQIIWISALSLTVWVMVAAVVAGIVHGVVKYAGYPLTPGVDTVGIGLGALTGALVAFSVAVACARDPK